MNRSLVESDSGEGAKNPNCTHCCKGKAKSSPTHEAIEEITGSKKNRINDETP
jgi:hypothetical protein